MGGFLLDQSRPASTTAPAPSLDEYLSPLDLSPIVDYWTTTPLTSTTTTDLTLLPTSPVSCADDDYDIDGFVSRVGLIGEDCYTTGEDVGRKVLELEGVLGSDGGVGVTDGGGVIKSKKQGKGRGRKGGRKPRGKEDEEEMERMRKIYKEVVMKQKKKTYKDAKPSNFCHICGRKAWLTQVAICGNLISRDCRKVICRQCFGKYGFDQGVLVRGAGMGNGYVEKDWKCPHCRDDCPSGSQCSTYKVTNYKRHVRLKETRLLKSGLGKTVKKGRKKKVVKKVVDVEGCMSSCSSGSCGGRKGSSKAGCDQVVKVEAGVAGGVAMMDNGVGNIIMPSTPVTPVAPVTPVKQEDGSGKNLQSKVSDAMASLLSNSFRS